MPVILAFCANTDINSLISCKVNRTYWSPDTVRYYINGISLAEYADSAKNE